MRWRTLHIQTVHGVCTSPDIVIMVIPRRRSEMGSSCAWEK